MIYPIVLYGNSVLRERAIEIVKGEVDVKKLSEDMFETMHNADGIGLAAPQIGISKRIFVIDGSMLEDEEMKDFKEVFINPTIELSLVILGSLRRLSKYTERKGGV